MKKEDGFVDDNHDIICEILTLLPVKSLMRFNCVSKAWNTLIRHDLDFAKLHFARCSARPRLLFEVYTLRFVEKGYLLTQPGRIFPLQLVGCHNYLKFIVFSNHCNGLVCLRNGKDDGQGYLYNITTGEIKALPFSLEYKLVDNPRLHLGYDPATKRYKLLCQVIRWNKTPRSEIRILTLGDNSWRGISGNIAARLNYYSSFTCLNGVLYWDNYVDSVVTYFNLTEEKFGTLSSPPKSRVNEIQSTFWGKLVMHPPNQTKNCHLVYDEVNKVFTKFDSDPNLVEHKLAFLEAENIDQRIECPHSIFATSSAISASTYLVFSNPFLLRHVSKFVENIVPLEYLF